MSEPEIPPTGTPRQAEPQPPAAEQPAVEQTGSDQPVGEPALALVGAGQPGRSALRRGETVSLAA